MRFIKYFMLLGVLFYLTGCAGASLGESRRNSIKNIGLAVMLESKINAVYEGLTIFNNFLISIPYEQNKYEASVYNAAEEYLKTKGLSVTSIFIDSELRNIFRVEENRYGPSEKFINQLTVKAKSHDVDTIVLLYDYANCTVSSTSGVTKGRQIRVSGHGLAAAIFTPVMSYSCLGIKIIDMKSGDTIVANSFAQYQEFYKNNLVQKIKDNNGQIKEEELAEIHAQVNKLFPKNVNKLFEIVNF